MKNDDEQSGLILAVIGIIPVIWFALPRQTHEWLSTANSIFFCFLSFQQFFQILDWAQTYYEPFLSHRQLMS